MLQFFQRHEINKMHKTPIVSLVFTSLVHFFSLVAAFAIGKVAFAALPVAALPLANAKWLYTLYLAAKRWILM